MKILLLGSGALKIGEAGEFDYSGSQAIKTFKKAGHEVILINPNIATVQTDSPEFRDSMNSCEERADEGISPVQNPAKNQKCGEKMKIIGADKVYFLPVNPTFVKKIILKEKPDALALSFGGQTALNCGLELEKSGFLCENKVQVLGTPVEVIEKTEDREIFVKELDKIGVKTPRSIAAYTLEEAKKAAEEIGFPLIMRAGFTLGGKGSGFCENSRDFEKMATEAFAFSPQILIEEDLRGWKEIEYEVVRDNADNCVTVLNMENFDPLGIHTGESIVVSPSMTLANREYQMLRTVAIKTIRHLGIVGECNIQYALNPHDDREYRVIEVNARLSRSSALASKASGYPLAAVAADILIGKNLPDIENTITKKTTAFFEPALDYIAIKIPRWDLQKFRKVSDQIATEMKSVGEVMALGRNFPETIQKAMRMLAIGAEGILKSEIKFAGKDDIEADIQRATPRRIFAITQALYQGIFSVEEIWKRTKIDHWFLTQLERITDFAQILDKGDLNMEILREAKVLGFSDNEIAERVGKNPAKIRELRKKWDIIPVTKQVDTLAAEFPAQTNYLYTTYLGAKNDV